MMTNKQAEDNRRAEKLEQENRWLRSICEQLVGDIARLNGKLNDEKQTNQ
jgi:hypothetical protein